MSKSNRQQSFHRPPDSFKRPPKPHTELRVNPSPSHSRSRSRDDRSKHSWSSQKSNRTSGPLIFGGNSSIKKSQRTDDKQQILSKPQFSKPKSKNASTNKDRDLDDEYAAWGWEEAEKENQLQWYDNDEGVTYDEEVEKKKLYETERSRNIQAEIEKKMAGVEPRRNFEQKHKNQQLDKWERNQLINSGIFKVNDVNNDAQQNEQNRVVLMVHDLKPPFLDGKTKFTTQLDQIQVVKDMNCDMALLAKKGSEVLKVMRQRNQKAKTKTNDGLEGTKMGKLLKVQQKNKQKDEIKVHDNGEIDYKDSSRFASLLAKKTQAVSDFARNKTLKEQREYLPIYEVREELVRLIRENKVLIIVGETGSGKTTQLTQYLKEEGYHRYGIIGCTQPRRVAAVSVAKRVAEEMDTELGKIVGYSIRFEDLTSNQTVIKYMTDGVLLRQSLNDSQLQMYSAIVMDQAHERSLNTDVLFGILRKVAQKRRDIKLIITSATMNAQKFSVFFGNAPIFTIPGRTFPVAKYFQKGPIEDYVDGAVKKAVAIHVQQPPGDILIFMTGQEDIEATCVLVEEKLKTLENVPPMLILPIYSQLRSEEQAKIFQSSPLRKCIVATNIAETSLTLDGVKYVIDTGFCKLKVYNPRIGMDALQITPISQANANQRAGRAGRTGPGSCYRLYSAAMFRNDLFQNNIPQIQRTNLCNVVLLLKSLNIQNLLQFDFMDPPPQDTILNSMYQLWILGALDNLGSLTQLGRRMAEFPVDPPLSKMIIVANDLGCIEEVLTIVSMISVPSIFFKPKDKLQEAEAAREKLLIPESDHLTYLNIFEQWRKHNFSTEWATEHFLQSKSLRKVIEVRSQLMDIAKQLGFRITSCDYNYDLVRKAICSGYFINASKVKGMGDYVNLRTGMPCKLHPSSSLFSLGYIPEYVVYHQLIMTSKEYMNCVTTVDPYWLAQLGPMFFSVKGEFNGKKTKQQKELQGENLMARELTEAKRRQKELGERRAEEEMREAEARRYRSQFVVEAGKKAVVGGLKTPVVQRPGSHII